MIRKEYNEQEKETNGQVAFHTCRLYIQRACNSSFYVWVFLVDKGENIWFASCVYG